MAEPERALAILNHLSAMGVQLAVDDFGTGHSSLAYLKRLPVNELKIDKSFVLDMLEDHNDAVIVRATIDLGHNLGMKVVAEGVETEEMHHRLKEFACDVAQGYYHARPLTVADFTKLLEAAGPASPAIRPPETGSPAGG
jgi:EAL domain-containing protein (putative c-di-GMP-specific phosphodiesterase class I)